MRNLFLYFILACAFACNNSRFGVSRGEQQNVANSVAENKIRFSFGLRNFREINAIMHTKVVALPNNSGKTNNVPLVSTAVETCSAEQKWHTYNHSNTKSSSLWCSGVKDLLPKSNNILGLTGPAQVGIFKLASTYCQQLMADNEAGKQARIQKLPTVATQINALTFSQRPADIDASLQSSLAAALVDNFHSQGLAVRPDAATTKSDLLALMAELISTEEEQGNRQASNQEVLVGACSAALASAQVMFH